MSTLSSIINLEDLGNSSRIDSEHYDTKYLNIENNIKAKKWKYLSEFVSEFIHPSEIKREYEEKGVLFLRAQNLRPLKLDLNNSVYISHDKADKLKKAKLKTDDILLTRTGANFGQCTIFNRQKQIIASSHVLILRTKNINPYYLAGFFNSEIGRNLINKTMYGAVQPEISPSYLKDMTIPIPDKKLQNKIESLVKSSITNYENSIKSYESALDKLEKVLGFTEIKLDNRNFQTLDLSSTQTYNRLDPEFWLPVYDQIESVVQSFPTTSILDLFDFKKGKEVGSEYYSSNGKDFIRVSDFTNFGIQENVEIKIEENDFDELFKSFQPSKNEILFTKDGTLGISFPVFDEIDGIISGAFLRLVPKKDLNLHFYSLLFSTKYCQYQFERHSYGSILKHLKPESLAEIKIPIIDNKKQNIIGKLYEDSLNMYRRSIDSKNEMNNLFSEIYGAI